MEGFDMLAKSSWQMVLAIAVVYGGMMLISAVRGNPIDFVQLMLVLVLLLAGDHMRLLARVSELEDKGGKKPAKKR
jgi:hypothetical protein